MGRHKKHPELKRLDGNPGRRPFDDLRIVAEGEPLCPDHLSDDATICFEAIVRSMPPGVYSRVDTYVLAAFAEAWSLHKRAVEAMNGQQSLIVKGKNGSSRNPLATIVAVQARLMVTLGNQLGLSPAARMSLGVPEQPRPKSKFEGLLGGGDWRH